MKIKGFDKDLRCRGMQYEVGKEYSTDAKHITSDDLCSNQVLHYCGSLQNVHGYYSCNTDMDNRYCEIEVLGEEVTDGRICGSNHIKIVREITGEELEILKGHINGNTGLFNNGVRNSGDWNSGVRNSGDWNSGVGNSGNYNSDYRNSGNYNSGIGNSGNCNSGDQNSGDCNSGDWNGGDQNSGDCNSGDWNSGDCNSGYCNSGDCNSGDWNSCNYSCGIFCNKDDDNIRIFNIPSGMSYKEFTNSKYNGAIHSSPFVLTEWVKYTDDEKKADIRKALDEGYLKTYKYKEACRNWWNNMSEFNRNIIKTLQNFDAEIFEDITGIKI